MCLKIFAALTIRGRQKLRRRRRTTTKTTTKQKMLKSKTKQKAKKQIPQVRYKIKGPKQRKKSQAIVRDRGLGVVCGLFPHTGVHVSDADD